MAEYAEQILQEMVPEFEELERLGLLTPKEIKKLIVKRRSFEYKLCKPKKEMQDFFAYTLYDSCLLELLAIRRQKVLLMKKCHKLENVMSHRVLKRLRMMSHLWPAHPTVWKFRLSFAKSRNFFEEVSTIYAEQIKFLGTDENNWVSWAQWEVEGRKNFEKARNILLSRAPLYHPKSVLITKEYFRLELLYLEFLKKRNETDGGGLDEIIVENREKVLQCAVPKAIFENALKEFNSPDICFYFYWIAHEFSFAHHLRDLIFSKMVLLFPNDIHMYRLKAKMIMGGYIVNETKEEKTKEESQESEDKKQDSENSGILTEVSLSPKQKLDALFTLYDDALSHIGPTFLDFIIEDLFNILNQVWGSDEFRGLVAKKLLEIFRSNSAALTVLQFLLWYTLASEENCSEEEKKQILVLAKDKHPNCQHIQLALLPFVKKMNFKSKMKLIEGLSGNVGAEICMQLINKTTAKLQPALIERACMHVDSTLSKTIRVKLLVSLTDLKDCREHYRKYCSLPPFCTRLHTSMIKKELQESTVSNVTLRHAFATAVDQVGHNQYGSWLSYMKFEGKFGQQKNVSRLQTEVEKQLNAKYLHNFIDSKFYLQSVMDKKMSMDNESLIVDCPEVDVEDSAYEFWGRSSLPKLFEADLNITHKAEQNRIAFFDSLLQINKTVKENMKKIVTKKENENKAWDEILSLIIGQNICLDSKKINLSDIGLDKDISVFINNIENMCEKSTSSGGPATSILSDETKKILESSEVLKPEFLQQKKLAPYYLNKNRVKKQRRKERRKDSGEGWFNMKAPEITPEMRRDLQILKMRSILNPHVHYKRNDMKRLPKYFQMGKVIDSPVDFYSSRVNKQDRKRTLAEEIMQDETILRYQKRKCLEITNMKNTKRLKRKQARIDERKPSKNKRKEKGKARNQEG